MGWRHVGIRRSGGYGGDKSGIVTVDLGASGGERWDWTEGAFEPRRIIGMSTMMGRLSRPPAE